MRNHSLYIILLIILLFISRNVIKAQNKTEVYILVEPPEYYYDLPSDYEDTYSQLQQEYFEKLIENNPILKNENFVIYFEFLDYGWWAGSIANLLKAYVSCLGDDGYDFVVINDRIFYNDVNLMETPYVEYYVDMVEPTIELLMDLKKYVKTQDISFHNPKQFNDGKDNSHIYGLPFEIDFDGLYYHNDDDKAKKIVNDIDNLTWDDLVQELKTPPVSPLEIALGVETDLLGFYVEYINNHYNLTKEYDPDYYQTFLNKTGDDLMNGFYNLTHLYTEEDIDNSVYLKRDEAYDSFYSNNSTFLRGKASLIDILTEDDSNISFTLPPKRTTNLYHKYIVVNKNYVNKKLSAEVYAEIAKVLTSREMQLFRAEHFGNIPTFDLEKKESDEYIKSYCDNHSKICYYLETMNKIFIKDLFKSKYGATYFEVECFLPLKIRYYLRSGSMEDFDVIKHVLNQIYYITTTAYGFDWYIFFSYVITIISICLSWGIMYYTHRFKNHSIIKVISPMFCNMIIFGCSMSMAKPLFRLPPYSHFKIRFVLIYNTVNYSLIYIPMIMVTYRIFRIYKSKTFLSNSLTNKRLMYITIILTSMATIYRMVIAFSSRVYYKMIGGVRENRMPYIYYSKYKIDSTYYFTYNNIIFFALLFMIIITGNYSKKFGDICYVFVVFIINVNDYMIDIMLTVMDEQYFCSFYFLMTIYNDLMIFICIYLLVGSRVLLILINPNYDKSKRDTTSDLIKYIPLNLSKIIKKMKSGSDSENDSTLKVSKLSSDTSILNKGQHDTFKSSVV